MTVGPIRIEPGPDGAIPLGPITVPISPDPRGTPRRSTAPPLPSSSSPPRTANSSTASTASAAPGPSSSVAAPATTTGAVPPTSSSSATSAGGGTASRICDKFGSQEIAGGRYRVQNNEWGASDGQCIGVTEQGFRIEAGDHQKPDGPAGYPSIVSGCWMGGCTQGTPLPAPIQGLGPITSSLAATTPGQGRFNLAYDIWADPTPRRDGQNTGMELMIWLKEAGGIAPIGTKTATAALGGATWDVWTGDNQGVNVVSYVRQGYVDRVDGLPLTDFVHDAVDRGVAQPGWYLTNIQAGFEPWSGGPGLSIDHFDVNYASPADGTDVPPVAGVGAALPFAFLAGRGPRGRKNLRLRSATRTRS